MEKKNIYLLNYLSILCIFCVLLYSCNKNTATPVTQIDTSSSSVGVWKEVADVPLSDPNIVGRMYATSFVIGDYAYVGLGHPYIVGDSMLSDFWKYDPNNNSWSGVAPMPIGREQAVSFVIDGKAYVGTGFNGNLYDSAREKYNDFYKYDPTNDTWSKIANFPGAARSEALSFVLNGKGYVLGGIGDDLWTYGYNDMYSYDPTSNTWNKEADFPVKNLYGASAFVCNHNNEAYVIGGEIFGANLSTGFYKFYPTTHLWIEFQDLKNYSVTAPLGIQYVNVIPRLSGASFVIDDSVAYITGGDADGSTPGGTLLKTTWAYYFQSGKWERRPSFTGSPFVAGVAFSINNQGYVGTGCNPYGTSSTVLTSKMYQFNPKGN
jgi:N-acetylneuraminic acid mutarotase